MKRDVLLLSVLAVLVLGGFAYRERGPIATYVAGLRGTVGGLAGIVERTLDAGDTSVPTVVREVLTDIPLRGPIEPVPSSVLSSSGVVMWTNTHRVNAGLPPLLQNTALAAAAAAKASDMFAQQYFAHDSPQGVGAGDLAERAGYAYILVGENLALGNYADDEALVAAWMNSPGHRANILHERFTEIGVAVLKGTFDGSTVWMAVQEFGLPISACPSPDDALSAMIDANKEELEARGEELEEKQEELENTEPKYGPAYNRAVREYNELVEAYNALLKETKTLVEEYNEQVSVFNVCASA